MEEEDSPNQVLTHAARAAATLWPRARARRALARVRGGGDGESRRGEAESGREEEMERGRDWKEEKRRGGDEERRRDEVGRGREEEMERGREEEKRRRRGGEEERNRGGEEERGRGRKGKIGCIKIFKSLVHNLDLKELNELRTRIFFFLKLDNGKSGLWVPLNSRLMTSSGHVTKMK